MRVSPRPFSRYEASQEPTKRREADFTPIQSDTARKIIAIRKQRCFAMDIDDPLLAHKVLSILLSSAVACLLLILTKSWHGKHSLDNDLAGVQKLHTTPVPRVGGLGLLVGLLAALAAGYVTNGPTLPAVFLLLVSAIPVFASGLVEDVTKRVSVRLRLHAAFVSAALAVWLLDAQLPGLDVPLLDDLMAFPLVAAAFTVFAVAGVTHSVNIIDGLNGLASGAVSIMLGGLAALAWMQGDELVMKLCLWGIASLAGFLVLNYPFGKIFLGDGGAYLAGFWLAQCAVLLLARNPEVSTWSVLLCCIYPVIETMYSMYRRHVIQKVPSGQPDMGHMHQLLFKRLSSRPCESQHGRWRRHGLTTAKIWAMTGLCQLVAVVAPESSALNLTAVGLACIVYVLVHRSLSAGGVSRNKQLERPTVRASGVAATAPSSEEATV